MKKPNKKPILLVDGMNAAYRAYHSHGKLTTPTGRSISMIYGYLNIVLSLKKIFKPHQIIVVWDGRKSKHRLAVHPEYKAHRTKFGIDVEDFYKQKEYVQKMLYRLGITQIHNEEVEADDYIALYTERFHSKYKRKIIIVSGDKDFGQLISKRVNQYIPSKNKVYNPVNFKREFGHSPEQVVDYLCLTGDKSDNIPGYGGIGEVKAAQFLKEHTSIQSYLENKWKDKIDRKKLLQVVERNSSLIDLKLFISRHLKDAKISYYRDNPTPKQNIEAYIKLCDKFAIRTFKTDEFFSHFPSKQLKNPKIIW